MKADNIKRLAMENTNFRSVVYTGEKSQLVVMSIPVGGDIGEEVHPTTDQSLFFVQGKVQAVVGGEKKDFTDGDVVFVPAGTMHNFINTGDADLKLFTVYAPPEHKDGTVHKTKEDAMHEEKH